MDKLNKIVLYFVEFNEMLLTKISPNMKIYSVLKAFLNPSSGLRNTESELSF